MPQLFLMKVEYVQFTVLRGALLFMRSPHMNGYRRHPSGLTRDEESHVAGGLGELPASAISAVAGVRETCLRGRPRSVVARRAGPPASRVYSAHQRSARIRCTVARRLEWAPRINPEEGRRACLLRVP